MAQDDDVLVEYLLHLADNALVLGQRNAEWCGHGPVLEEDIAMANISVDLIGQARLLNQYVAVKKADGSTEDSLAFFRDAQEFRNYTLLELPHDTDGGERDYAVTIVRNFLYSALMVLLWKALESSSDTQLAGIAGRSLKETRYHLRHSRDWMVRMGDGTAESHRRAQAALDYLWPFTAEFWAGSAMEDAAVARAQTVPMASLHSEWTAIVSDALTDATLTQPTAKATGAASFGKTGAHTPHLTHLLDEMQSLARQHPQATW
jgi:ring-1,2-phenylacetyl-CoA epoxidase subunit PaaC